VGSAQRGDDALYFYAADLGITHALEVTATASQLPDVVGALRPGRYLIHAVERVPAKTVVWIRTGKFVLGAALDIAAAPPWFPLRVDGIVAIEINVRKGHNDRIAAITDGGSATLYVTRVSRDV